jgi:hypothetical protein
MSANRRAIIVLIAVAAAAGHATGQETEMPSSGHQTIEFDCIDSPGCPAIAVIGEPSSDLPDGSLSRTRGTVDASILTEEKTGKLWLSYTFVSSHVAPPSLGSEVDPSVNVFLASSGDSGTTWTFETALRPSAAENDPVTGKPGYSGNEVSSIVTANGRWYLANLRFHDSLGGGNSRRPDSFHFEVRRATSPAALAAAEPVRLAGAIAADAWSDHRLNTLDPECSSCTLWLDPELFLQDGHLYLLAVCTVYEERTRRTERGFYGVFELSDDPDNFGEPRWVGKLADSADAVRLGAKELSKGDLTIARDGTIRFLTAPVFRGARFEEYPGCYAFEVESLDPPRLRRDADGEPIARAVLRSSDSIPSGASCAYAPESKTGLILTRREMRPDLGAFVWSLHATGVHP